MGAENFVVETTVLQSLCELSLNYIRIYSQPQSPRDQNILVSEAILPELYAKVALITILHYSMEMPEFN